ncbi:hypothetical protein QJQ45_020575 [Haematococcus lacustris]|nr:hypothetical protein QJQ45_020575 [Haematococcus lacustris]
MCAMNEAADEEYTVQDLLADGARYGDLEDVEAALAQGAQPNAADSSSRTDSQMRARPHAALHMASANGHLEIVQRLLAAGATPDLPNAEGSSALHWACLNGHSEVVRALLDRGAVPSLLNRANRTPVDEALDRGHDAVMDVIRAFSPDAGVDQAVESVETGEAAEEGEEAAEEEIEASEAAVAVPAVADGGSGIAEGVSRGLQE